MQKILVSRFSALGDVAIAVHVVKAFLEQNPDCEIVFLTKPHLKKIFPPIERLDFVEVDLKNTHKGISGLRKLAKEIELLNVTHYADFHNVLRTKIIRFFISRKIPKAIIDKGRKEKKLLTKQKNKELRKLKHSAERYADVFRQLGFEVDLKKYKPHFQFPMSKLCSEFLDKLSGKIIGIAPFAAHETKMYPLDRTEEIIGILSRKYTVLIFGGGKKEQEIAENWQKKYRNVVSVIGKYSFEDEINLIAACEKIITMDSGNMHLASFTNTQIISIWGATHPYLGFSPFKKDNTVYIQKNLPCRPCSVFGNKKCRLGTMECLDIPTDEIVENFF